MADIVTPEVRSRIMAAIRTKDTSPEMLIRRLLHREGFRYRLHVASLPGKPDLVFPSTKAAVFVNGCYWHGHDCSAFRLPKSNRRFWRAKIEVNRKRDQKTTCKLNAQGWRVMVIWECAFRGPQALDQKALLRLASKWLKCGRHNFEIRSKAM